MPAPGFTGGAFVNCRPNQVLIHHRRNGKQTAEQSYDTSTSTRADTIRKGEICGSRNDEEYRVQECDIYPGALGKPDVFSSRLKGRGKRESADLLNCSPNAKERELAGIERKSTVEI